MKLPWPDGAALVFGRPDFDEREEYLAFRFRLLAALTLGGAFATLLFVLGSHSGANPVDPRHTRMMGLFCLASLTLWALLRGRKQRFRPVAWAYLLLSLAESASSLWFADADELRLLWFYVAVPGTYLILGRRTGGAVALATAVGLVAVNPWLSRPYSAAALTTAVVAVAYLAFLFHIHSARAVSYFKRMRAYNEQLSALAAADPLTGLRNARSYYAECERQMAAGQRRGAHATVLFIDLDHFKRINDRHGHDAGDAVLRGVAHTLSSQLRRSDLIGRIGGEEFSVFLPDTPPAQALTLAEKLRAAVEARAIDSPAGPLRVTASIGVAGGHLDGLAMAQLQQRADAAMYQAKAAGRNRVAWLALEDGGDTEPPVQRLAA